MTNTADCAIALFCRIVRARRPVKNGPFSLPSPLSSQRPMLPFVFTHEIAEQVFPLPCYSSMKHQRRMPRNRRPCLSKSGSSPPVPNDTRTELRAAARTLSVHDTQVVTERGAMRRCHANRPDKRAEAGLPSHCPPGHYHPSVCHDSLADYPLPTNRASNEFPAGTSQACRVSNGNRVPVPPAPSGCDPGYPLWQPARRSAADGPKTRAQRLTEMRHRGKVWCTIQAAA